MWTRSELKARAKEVLKLNYWKAVLVSLICNFVSGSGGGGSSSSSSTSDEYSSSGLGSGSMTKEDLTTLLIFLAVFLIVFVVVMAISVLLTTFVFNPLYVGCCRFFINCGNGTASLNDVTFAFSSSYMNIVKVMFFRWLYTFLWSLLFIIPGIVKGYEYRMIPYLLAEDATLSKENAFRMTKEMMTGDKANTWVLDLSFIGWYLLGTLTCCILIIFYVGPYEYLTNAELYKVLKSKLTTPFGSDFNQQTTYSDAFTNNNDSYYQNPYSNQ